MLTNGFATSRIALPGGPIAPAPAAVMRFTPRPGRLSLPDVRVDLIWNGRTLVLAGPQTRAMPSKRVAQSLLLLSFDPAIAASWLRMPLSELVDRECALADLDGPLAHVLQPAFEEGRAAALFATTRGSGGRLTKAADSLSQGASVAAAAAQACMSERQLERRFALDLGLRPKHFSRILRLRRAIRDAKLGLPIGQAALAAGFADQSHLANEARALAGAPLRRLLPNVGNLQEIELGRMA